MPIEKSQEIKANLHSRNRNRERYDIRALMRVSPELEDYVKPNRYGQDSIDFSNPDAVKILNRALLNYYYGIKYWEFSDENLCPPIPGRADYIHHVADLLSEYNFGVIPIGDKITCLDVGVGASCIYPIIGVSEYDWRFIGSDVDPRSIEFANTIVNNNLALKDQVECRLQKNHRDVFLGIIGEGDTIDLSICNPPFHSSVEELQKGLRRKVKNLTGKDAKSPESNFSGMSSELVCEGGEYQFIHNMITESRKFAKNCFLFSTLVSKQSNLKRVSKLLGASQAKQVRTKPMGTGNKSTRIVAWTFLSEQERKVWAETRWGGTGSV